MQRRYYNAYQRTAKCADQTAKMNRLNFAILVQSYSSFSHDEAYFSHNVRKPLVVYVNSNGADENVQLCSLISICCYSGLILIIPTFPYIFPTKITVFCNTVSNYFKRCPLNDLLRLKRCFKQTTGSSEPPTDDDDENPPGVTDL